MNKRKRDGFTLIEIIVVIACIALLAGIIAPLAFKNIEDAKKSAAEADVKAIASAMMQFNKDLGFWPTMDAAGNINSIPILFSTADGQTPQWPDPGEPLTGGEPLDWHLMRNGGPTEGGGRYKNWDGYSGWNGAYLHDVHLDPWGRSYVVYTVGFWGGDDPTVWNRVWILSAGPDNVLNMDATSNSPYDSVPPIYDDIGVRLK